MSGFVLRLRQKVGDWLNNLKGVEVPQSFKGPISEKKSILILGDISTEAGKKEVQAVKKEARQMCPNAEVFILGYGEETKQLPISDKYEEYFSPKDLSFFFKMKSQRLASVLSKGYDLMIVANGFDCERLNYVAKYAVASLRVGRAGTVLDANGLLNFVIETKSGDDRISEKVRSCLQMVFETKK